MLDCLTCHIAWCFKNLTEGRWNGPKFQLNILTRQGLFYNFCSSTTKISFPAYTSSHLTFCLVCYFQRSFYIFSPVWDFVWLVKVPFWRKHFPQVSQEYGFSPLWILIWRVKLLLRVKLFPQVSQEYGLSPVWILMCFDKLLLRLKLLPQVSQKYGFSPVWILVWTVKE